MICKVQIHQTNHLPLILYKQPSQAASLEDQRGFYRQDAFISRRVHQLRGSPPGSSGSDGPVLPPGLQITTAAEEAYLETLRQRDREIYTPFRHARIPELRELGPPARMYNAGVSALEDENMRKVDRPVVERPPKRSFFGTVLNWAHSIVRGNVESHGVRLCSHCSRYLDRMNPPESDRADVQRLHQVLGIWPPLRRVQNVGTAMRKCAVCQRSEFAILYAHYDLDE